MTHAEPVPAPPLPGRRRRRIVGVGTLIVVPALLAAAGFGVFWWWDDIVIGWHVFRLDPESPQSRAATFEALEARGEKGWAAIESIALAPGIAPAGEPWTGTRQQALDRVWAHDLAEERVTGPRLSRYLLEARGLRRHAALAALGGVWPKEQDALVDPAVEALLTDPDPEAQRLVMNFLCLDVRSSRALPALREIASESPHSKLRAGAINDGLARMPDPQNVPTLRAALADADPDVRYGAAWALASEHGDAKGLPILLATLDPAAPANDRRLTTAAALARLGDPRTIAALITAHDEASGDGAPMVRRHCNRALQALTDHRLDRDEDHWSPWWQANHPRFPEQLDPKEAKNAPIR